VRAADSDELAAKLGRPPASMSALRGVTPEQIRLLSDAIDGAAASRQRAVDEAFHAAFPFIPRGLLVRILRFGDGRQVVE